MTKTNKRGRVFDRMKRLVRFALDEKEEHLFHPKQSAISGVIERLLLFSNCLVGVWCGAT